MIKMQKKIRNLFFGVAGLSVIAIPLQLAASCGSSEETPPPVIKVDTYDTARRYSLDKLNAEAETIPGENNIPWRRSVSYEGLSQVFSFARAVAYELGWNDIDGGKASKVAVVKDDSITKTPDEIRALTGVTSAQAPDKTITDFINLKSSAAYSIKNLEHVKLSSYLPIGDDTIEEKKNIRDAQNAGSRFRVYFGVDDSRFPYSSYQGADVPNSSDIISGNYGNGTLLKAAAWSDHNNPGQIMLSAENNQISRIITLPGAGYIYPTVDAKVYTEKFIPVFLELFKRLNSLSVSAGTGVIANSVLRAFEFLKEKNQNLDKDAATAQKLIEIFTKLNNGSHHLLAIKAAAYGFDSTFASPVTNPLFCFAATNDWIKAPNSQPALLDQTKNVFSVLTLAFFSHPTDYFKALRTETSGTESRIFGTFDADPSYETPFLPFYTNTEKLNSHLLKMKMTPSAKIRDFNVYDLSSPFSKEALDAAVSRIVDVNKSANVVAEADVPWRRGIGYEAVSHTFSYIRSVAYALGWSDSSAAKASKCVLLDDADRDELAKTNDVLRQTYGSETTDEVLDKYRSLVPKTTPFLASHKAASFLALGDDSLLSSAKGDVSLSDYFNVNDTNFDYAKYGGTSTKIVAWSDLGNPGTVRLKINSNEGTGKKVARIITLPGVGYVYPTLEAQTYKVVYTPILRHVLDRLVSLDWATAGSNISADVIGMLTFLKNKIANEPSSSDQINSAIERLNNGSHHILAIVAGAKGFDNTLLGKTTALAAYTRGSTNWNGLESLPGFLDTKAALNSYLRYVNFARPGLGALKYGDDPSFTTQFVPFYTGLTTTASLLQKANVK